MVIDKHINYTNWGEIKDILPDITEIKSLDLSGMGLTEFHKMSHITIKRNFWCYSNQLKSFNGCPLVNGDFNCCNNQITSFKDCPDIGGNFYCSFNQIKSFKDCPIVNGDFYSDIMLFNIIYKYSKKKKISLLKAQVKLYNKCDKELLEHIDKLPDLIAYNRLKSLKYLLD